MQGVWTAVGEVKAVKRGSLEALVWDYIQGKNQLPVARSPGGTIANLVFEGEKLLVEKISRKRRFMKRLLGGSERTILEDRCSDIGGKCAVRG